MEKYIDQITYYLNKELSVKEAQEFESALLQSPELREEVEFARYFLTQKKAIQEELQLKEAIKLGLKELEQEGYFEHTEETKSITPLFRRPGVWLSIAAGIAILFTLWFVSRPNNPQNRYEEFAENSISQYLQSQQKMSGSQKDDFNTAIKAEEYDKAYSLLNTISDSTKREFFTAQLKLRLDIHDPEAEKILINLMSDQETGYLYCWSVYMLSKKYEASGEISKEIQMIRTCIDNCNLENTKARFLPDYQELKSRLDKIDS
ncbi:MAG: hypothetical protein AAFY71_28285 [Bacteroidota bacterium]